MSKVLSKLLISVLTAIVLLISVAPAQPARAANEWYSQGALQWYSKVYNTSNPNEIFGERYTAAQVQWVFYGVIFGFINSFIGDAGKQCLVGLGSGNIGSCALALVQF